MRKPLFLFLLSLASYTLSAQTQNQIQECIVEKGELKVIKADYNPTTGEKTIMVNGVRKKLDEVYTLEGAGYAAAKAWFINNEKITFLGKPYQKYGLPRVLGISEVKRLGENDGVSVFAEPREGIPQVIYLPVRRGCEFQPYILNCGNVSLTGEAETPTGKTYTLKADSKDIKGKLTYNWKVSAGKIIKGQGTKQITVSTEEVKPGFITITLEATTADKCPIRLEKWVKVVEKTSSSQPNKKS
ncbi:MAG TPA: hypothetical protein VGB46_00695 [Flavisolibacter sp.]|jgi:hypothetical protein